ncbi:PAXNEB-domain-containing protein [Amylocystis lapponica]|nr:PAXNEB-domain-containing protein [Amylocystis lapponica]
MSSFKRRSSAKQPPLPTGTRTSPASTSTFITSTGIPSLDDILGDGLPLSCSLLVLAPDAHSAYGELVQKYFIAQGLASHQQVCIIDANAKDILGECMWMPGGSTAPSAVAEDEDEEKTGPHDAKIKIAWRYEQMKQFRTTVSAAASSSNQSAEEYCRTYDLTTRIPDAVTQSAFLSGRLVLQDVSSDSGDSPTRAILKRLAKLLEENVADETPLRPIRLCIPSLGSSQWGDLSPQDICFFLHSLRALLRRYPHACASVCLPPHLCADTWGGPGWVQKLGWLSDACISLSAFTANPSLSALFSAHHGLVHIHALPAPHTLLPLSDRFSTLRGLSASGENNLAFKCMRKRLVFETLHLDLEGGVGERRTTPAPSALPAEVGGAASHAHVMPPAVGAGTGNLGGRAAVEVRLEQLPEGATAMGLTGDDSAGTEVKSTVKKPKAKKKVAFHSDRPDLYDF